MKSENATAEDLALTRSIKKLEDAARKGNRNEDANRLEDIQNLINPKNR